MKHSNSPLLSICIPTYNRASYIDECVRSILCDPGFDDRVEIVVSDNASTDNTQEVVKKYTKEYPNIIYHRNEKNVVDENFGIVLREGHGKYRKLINDTVTFDNGMLSEILNELEKGSQNVPVFFFQDHHTTYKSAFQVNNIDDFINGVNFAVTWLSNFGMWETDLDVLENSDQFYSLKFPHMAWALRIIQKHGCANIKICHFYNSKWPKNKGGYNFFEVQLSNYFKVLKIFGVKWVTFQRAKFRRLKNEQISHIIRMLILKQADSFDTSKAWKVILKEYGLYPYFYIIFTYNLLRKSLSRVLKWIKIRL